jgi:KaiC/GvpD/RAD55 family RecA-like ATPase
MSQGSPLKTDAWESTTGIPELDELLGGGKMSGTETKVLGKQVFNTPSMLIIGDPGCGKTTISLYYAIETIRRGRSAVIFSFEETYDDMKLKVQRLLELQNDVTDAIIISLTQGAAVTEYLPTCDPSSEPPVIAIDYYPNAVMRGFFYRNQLVSHVRAKLELLDKLVESHRVRPLGGIILDPMPADLAPRSFLGRRDAYRDRALFKGVCELGSLHNAITLLVVERIGETDWREFVADIVLELTWDRTDASGWRRLLRIMKARQMASWDGAHSLRFDAQGRILLSPANSELSRHVRANASPADEVVQQRFTCSQAINDFICKGDGCIPRGSTTLVYGEDETRKNLLAIRFLQAVVTDGAEAHCLLIACGSTPSVAKSLAEHYADSGASSEEFLGHRLCIESGPVTGEGVDEFLARIRSVLKTRNFSRVVVDDESALHHNEIVSHLLREVFVGANITSLFVRTVDQNVHDMEREFYDTVIQTKHVVLPGGKRAVGFWLVKLKGRAGDGGRWHELIVKSPAAEVELRDSFRNLREVEGVLSHEPLVLRLHARDRTVESFWNHFIETGFSHFFVHQSRSDLKLLFFGDGSVDLVFDSLQHWPEDIQADVTQIVSVDEFWAEGLRNRSILCPIEEFFNSTSPNEFERFDSLFGRYPSFVQENTPRHAQTGQVLVLPHQLDFGVYAYRRDILEHLRNVVGTDAGKAREAFDRVESAMIRGSETYSWRDIACLSRFLRSRDVRDICLLDCRANGTAESVLCFFLEVMWQHVFERSENGWSYVGFSCEESVHAALEFCQSLNDVSPFLWRGPADKPASRGALLQRHWLVSLAEAQRSQPKENLAIVPQPQLEGDGFSKSAAVSIRGDWYFGVVKGRLGEHWVRPLLLGMLSEDRAVTLSSTTGAMPPFESLVHDKRFTSANGQPYAAMYKRTVTRRDIPHYSDHRAFLAAKVYELFEFIGTHRDDIDATRSAETIKTILSSFDERLHPDSTPLHR